MSKLPVSMSILVMFFIDVVRFAVRIFNVVHLLEDVEVVLTNFDVICLVADVDRVDRQDEFDVLCFLTVLDVQGDVDAVLYDLL